jgi:hypothetical protein
MKVFSLCQKQNFQKTSIGKEQRSQIQSLQVEVGFLNYILRQKDDKLTLLPQNKEDFRNDIIGIFKNENITISYEADMATIIHFHLQKHLSSHQEFAKQKMKKYPNFKMIYI